TNELYQLASVAFCLIAASCSDKLGLSLELGSFAAGVMISTTDHAQHTLEQVSSTYGRDRPNITVVFS
nr:K(+) efflux antiporter 4 [Tanacetum cinerariifolium]